MTPPAWWSKMNVERLKTLPKTVWAAVAGGALVLVLVVAFLLVVALGEDEAAEGLSPASAATEAVALERHDLDEAGAPLRPAVNRRGDAGSLYAQALTQVMQSPTAAASPESVRLVLDAGQLREVSEGFFDGLMPVDRSQDVEAIAALDALTQATVALALQRQADPAVASHAAVSALLLLERTFEHNLRLPARARSLDLLAKVGPDLLDARIADEPLLYGPEGQHRDAVLQMLLRVPTIQRYWLPKLAVLTGDTLNVQDVVNILNEDQDPSFRLEAVTRLATLIPLAPNGEARDALKAQLKAALQRDDPQIRAAAQAVQKALPVEFQ